MEQIKILIVEDDKDLSSIIKDYLTNEGYDVDQAMNGPEAVEKARDLGPTLILLDLMLPGINGVEVCKQIRTFSFCPIIVISAKSSDADKLLSLGVGADDYLTKPFSFIEMIGRIKSHIRRFTTFQTTDGKIGKEPKFVLDELIIDPNSFSVTLNGVKMQTTTKEFKLLYFLCSHKNQVFSKEQLLTSVWGYDSYLDDNTVAVYVGRLREKLSSPYCNYLKTVWGMGYKWEPAQEDTYEK